MPPSAQVGTAFDAGGDITLEYTGDNRTGFYHEWLLSTVLTGITREQSYRAFYDWC